MKIIEIIGPPCSGKTYFKNVLERKLKNDKIYVSTYSKTFFRFVFKEKNLTLLDLITLLYFKYFRLNKELNIIKKSKNQKKLIKHSSLKNPISDFFYKNYFEICKKISLNKNKKIQKIIYSKIQKNQHVNNLNRNAYLWFIEFFAYLNILNKNKKKVEVLIDDEGVMQKLFIFSELKFDKNFTKKYINLSKDIDLLIHLKTTKNKINQRSVKRFGSNKFYYRNTKHLNEILKYDKKITNLFKNNNITLLNIKFYNNIPNKIYERIKK